MTNYPPPGQPQWAGQPQYAGPPAPRKNWFARHKVLSIGGGVFLALIIIGVAASPKKESKTPAAASSSSTTSEAASSNVSSSSATPTSSPSSEASTPQEETKPPSAAPTTKAAPEPAKALYPGRPGAKKGDHEAALGSPVDLSGYTTAVKSAKFVQKISVIEEKGYLIAHVAIKNRDKSSQSYNQFQFKLQTPGGQVVDSTFSSADGGLGSGDLIQGGTIEGDVVFDVGKVKGQYYLLYLPEIFGGEDRGVWGVKI